MVRWSLAIGAALGRRRLWVDDSRRCGDDRGQGLVGFEEGREARRLVVVAEAGIACGGGDLAGKRRTM